MNQKIRNIENVFFLPKLKAGAQIIGAIFVALLLILSFLELLSFLITSETRQSYDGKIIDKKISTGESEEGSFMRRRLLIQDKAGLQFRLTVSEEIYNQAEIGKLISKKDNEIKITNDVFESEKK